VAAEVKLEGLNDHQVDQDTPHRAKGGATSDPCDKAPPIRIRAGLGAWLAKAQAHELVGADNPAAMAAHFLAALGGALLIQLLLRVRDAPAAGEIELRARTASESLVLLLPAASPR
jgi:hypothetical protein